MKSRAPRDIALGLLAPKTFPTRSAIYGRIP